MKNSEKQIKKLINEYTRQIEEYDMKINIVKEAESKLRGENLDKSKIMDREDLREERGILNAQRQRTVQFVSDLQFMIK
jgi:hypothetical protein